MTSSALRSLLPWLLLLAGVLAAGPVLTPVLAPLPGREVYRRVLPGVGWVHAPDRGKGSGWLVDRGRRWLVTSYHVVGDNKSVEVFFPVFRQGQAIADRDHYLQHRPELLKSRHVVSGKVLQRDPDRDLALVELEALPAGAVEMPLAACNPTPGERVHAIGNRYDTDSLWLHAAGVVRQVRILHKGYFNSGKELGKGACIVEAQAPINEGDSGGPLVNGAGAVVGVAAAVAWEHQGDGLFIAATEVRAFLDRARGTALPAPPSVAVAPGADVYRRGVRALALVQAEGSPRRASGWLLDHARWLVLTTAEVVGRNKTLELTFAAFPGDRLQGDIGYYRDQEKRLRESRHRVLGVVLYTDPRRNLALLEAAALPEGREALRLAEAPVAPGDPLHGLGNPERLDALWLYSAGWVRQQGKASLGQTAEGPDPEVLLIQAPLNEGEGGGPWLSDRGEVVAVHTGRAAPQQQIVYGLTAAEVKVFLDEARPRWAPRGAAEWIERGLLFVKARQFPRAVQDYSTALEAEPASARACSERGWARQLLGDARQALADCDRAVQLDDRLASAWRHRAATLISLGQWADAVASCERSLKLDPTSALTFALRAEARRLRGDLVGALADCEEALWLDRQRAEAYLVRGQVRAVQDQNELALADFSRALELDPHLAAAYRCRADVNWARSDVAAALADYQQALARRPEDALAHLGRGRARAARQETELAQADFDAALRLDPNLAAAFQERGHLGLHRGDLDGALDNFRQALRRQPDLLPSILGVIERRLGELTRGEPTDRKAAVAIGRRGLLELRPFLPDKQDLRQALDAGLKEALQGADDHEQIARLCAVFRRLREKL
jgi:tetratricopeptide (TPR) repeat protein